tara:strand:+ start:726 stop:926 length:201 start_codon:yes stop_codon:yes gene_type:complete
MLAWMRRGILMKNSQITPSQIVGKDKYDIRLILAKHCSIKSHNAAERDQNTKNEFEHQPTSYQKVN